MNVNEFQFPQYDAIEGEGALLQLSRGRFPLGKYGTVQLGNQCREFSRIERFFWGQPLLAE